MAKDYTKTMDASYAILTQFQKDFSFENPSIMKFLLGAIKEDPQHNMDWNLAFEKLQNNDYEVVMKMNMTAKVGKNTLYIIDIEYGAIVRINEKNLNITTPILSAEVPSQLYPFIRAIIARAVADGGYPPLLLPPIDFHGHFMARMKELEKKKSTDESASGTGNHIAKKPEKKPSVNHKKNKKLN
ncbi:MAG: protein-export chaperone SecB [Alphaproteobacteria bacterium]